MVSYCKHMKTNFEFGQEQEPFMREVQRILIQQDDFRGMGGHGPEESKVHGLHSQVSIGIGNNTTANFRRLADDQ